MASLLSIPDADGRRYGGRTGFRTQLVARSRSGQVIFE
jgi:hypothetical protein